MASIYDLLHNISLDMYFRIFSSNYIKILIIFLITKFPINNEVDKAWQMTF